MQDKIDYILIIITILIVASFTVCRPVPSGKMEETGAYEKTYYASLSGNRELMEAFESETKEEELTEAHCTDPVSAWVEEIEDNSAAYSLDYGAEDSFLLARIAYAEACGEDLEGQALVIRVVLNRVWSDKFPDTISEVLYQENQFAGVLSDRWQAEELPDMAWEALALVESGWDESEDATYFCTEAESDWHRLHLQELFTHGGHVFFKE